MKSKVAFLSLVPSLLLSATLITPAFAQMGTTTMMTTTMTTTAAQPMVMAPEANLMIGSYKNGVSGLQAFLVEKGYLVMPAGVSFGYFGSLTKSALVRYQSDSGLPSTGYYGPLTRAKINAALSMSTSMGGSMNTMSQGVMVGGALMTPNRDIVANAMNANNVTTVVAAVSAAGLVSTLQGPGPFTVFAPNNAAFAKLPAGTVDTLLKPENKAQLSDILTYHVVAGAYKSSDLYDGQMLTTVEGKMLTIHKDASGHISINGTAMVETPDVISKNGVTFVIDTVLMPPTGVMVGGALMTPDRDIVANAMSASNVTTLVAAVQAAGLVSTLQGTGPFTVFAPDNAAFAKLASGTVSTLLMPANKAQLSDILTYHVVPGVYKSSDLYNGEVLTTVEGKKLTITKDTSGKIMVNGSATVETSDVISKNGVTFVIDTVLMPPTN